MNDWNYQDKGFNDKDLALLTKAIIEIHPQQTRGRKVLYRLRIGDGFSGPITRRELGTFKGLQLAIFDAAKRLICPLTPEWVGRAIVKRDFIPRLLEEADRARASYILTLKGIDAQ
jgi:hypothetical protein